MQTPSVFYTWLCDQVAREDAVGQVAAHAVLDEDWPKAETEKEPLRAYLRSKGLGKFVQPLAVALREFDQAMKDHFKAHDETMMEGLKLGRSRLGAPAFWAWCELNFPKRDKIAELAESGNAAARTIFGVRLLLGIEAPENSILALRMLTSSFEGGFTSAATILDRYYSMVFDIDHANEWLVRGARGGDKNCICSLHARIASAKSLRLSVPLPEIDEAELETLVAAHVGDTGEVEWMLATALDPMGVTDGALALYQTAALKGWPAAHGDGASLLKRLGRTKEANEWIRRGAVAGDYMCKGEIAMEVLGKELGGGPPCHAGDRMKHIRNLEIAAEHGVTPALLPMATLYERGDGVPQDTEKAMALLTVAYVTARDESERDAAAYFVETIFPEHEGHLPVRPAIDWLIASAQKTRAQGISAVAADAWLSLGMELPTD
jgi:TPR repeat protein